MQSVSVTGIHDVAEPVSITERRYVHGREVASVFDAAGRFVLAGSIAFVHEQIARHGWRAR